VANWQRARDALAWICLTLQRQREDCARKPASALVSSHGMIALEDLQIRNLSKNRRLAKAISDVSWARYRWWVEYYGRVQQVPVIAVPPHSTTQRCSCCGELVQKSLSVRTPVCPHCGLLLDRDHNTALVIREVGLAQASRQGIWDPKRHRVLPSGTVGHTGP
jgi:putative transposase